MIPRPLPASDRPRIELHIESLVVDASLLAPGQRAVLQAAVVTELGRILAEQGVPSHLDAEVTTLTAGNIQVAERSSPARLGQQIAQSVHAALGPANPPPVAARTFTGESR